LKSRIERLRFGCDTGREVAVRIEQRGQISTGRIVLPPFGQRPVVEKNTVPELVDGGFCNQPGTSCRSGILSAKIYLYGENRRRRRGKNN
jgi:hypothetical protein